MAAHGSEPKENKPSLRSSNKHNYLGKTKVSFLSFAGLANVTTEMGIITKGEGPIAEKLCGKGIDYGILAHLTPKVFKVTTDSKHARGLMKDFMEEIMKLGKDLVGIEYSKTSPPVIIENPQFDKSWWFADNPGHDLRKRSDRSNPSRPAGATKDNPIIAIPGLYILQTSRPELKTWSLSDITGRDEYTPDGFLEMRAIKKRNLLRKIKYTSFWKPYIDNFDFSTVPDEGVMELSNVTEAVVILKQIYYAFNSKYAMDDPDDEEEINDFIEEVGEDMLPQPPKEIKEMLPPPPKEIIKMLAGLLAHSGFVTNVVGLVESANERVKTNRAIFLEAANRADLLEEQIKQLEDNTVTRSKAIIADDMTTKLRNLDTELDVLRIQLTTAKSDAATVESELDEIKGVIIDNITEIIRNILSSKLVNPDLKAVIKNIIMRNKLKNILKTGILHKVLTLRQVIIFFRGLGYNIDIVDPSCFVLREKDPPREATDTQEMSGSQDGLVEVERYPPPHWSDELARLAGSFEEDRRGADSAMGSKRPNHGKGGGTKRKRSMRSYSRKRRTRRKRYTRRR
jgi:hypothetical protein